jgi:hypothetical protein
MLRSHSIAGVFAGNEETSLQEETSPTEFRVDSSTMTVRLHYDED